MENIVFLDAYTIKPEEVSLNLFSDFGAFKFYDRTKAKDILERAENASIILTNKTPLSKETLLNLPNLKLICVVATGYNIVDIEAAKELGITVCNAAGYSTFSVAQQTVAMILHLSNRLSEHNDFSKWASQPDFCYYNFSFQELQGKVLGLVGFGEIAQKVADIAIALGMEVSFYKPSPLLVSYKNCKQVDFVTLLETSDIVSLHCPLTATNKEMMNAEAFRKMKNTSYLINTARGALINENDLKLALENKEIAAAYLDVLSVEPPAADHILADVKNLYLSPHIAWASLEARKRLIEIVYRNISGFLSGQVQNVVN